MVIIYGRTLERAKIQLDILLSFMKEENIRSYRKARQSYEVIFFNGLNIKAVVPNPTQRGMRYNIAYIDHTISQQLIEEVILPCGGPSKHPIIIYY